VTERLGRVAVFGRRPQAAWRERRRPLTRGADPILPTFGHIVSADIRWLARWRGEPPPAVAMGDFPSLDEVRRAWEHLYRARRSYIGSLDDAMLRERITWPHRERPIPIPRWQAMVHCANHGTQHRSEIAAMLTDLGHSPGDLDMVLYCVEQAQA
jgi:uncharacterized damage-inducible protein DinB